MKNIKFLRKKLIFQCDKKGIINFNYNYEIMKKIYNALSLNNMEYSKTLHSEKYFKGFNFNLCFPKPYTFMNKNGINVTAQSIVILTISGEKSVVDKIVSGFILLQKFSLDDVLLRLINIEDCPVYKFDKIMLYKVVSAAVETYWTGERHPTKGYAITDFYKINEIEFFNALGNNLKKKYEHFYGEEYTGRLYFDIENALDIKQKIINDIKTQKKVGYSCDLWIEAEPKMQKMAYYLGLGQNNSLGLGFLNTKKI